MTDDAHDSTAPAAELPAPTLASDLDRALSAFDAALKPLVMAAIRAAEPADFAERVAAFGRRELTLNVHVAILANHPPSLRLAWIDRQGLVEGIATLHAAPITFN